MNELLPNIQLVIRNNLLMEKVRGVLNEVNNILYIRYEYLSNDFEDVPYEIPGICGKLRKINEADVLKIVSKLESNSSINLNLLKQIHEVVVNNEEVFAVSEVLTQGITYSEALNKLRTVAINMKCFLECSGIHKLGESSEIIQIELGAYHLDDLIIIIVQNLAKKIVLISPSDGRGILSPFLLIHMLHKTYADLKNKITLLIPKKEVYVADNIICTQMWVNHRKNSLQENKIFSVKYNEPKSCFLILSHSNLFISVANYVDLLGGSFSNSRRIPTLCLVQENIYTEFVHLLKEYLAKSKEINLFDRNRQIAVNYCENSSQIGDLIAAIHEQSNLNVLSSLEPCGDERRFYPTFVIDNCQPQQPLFNNSVANKFCSFILTFRTCQDGLQLANDLYCERDSVYLWTESISQCFSLKKQLNYNEIFVNVAQNYVNISDEPRYKYVCSGSFFISKSAKDATLVSPSELRLKFEYLNTNSNWREQSFHHRYCRVVEMTTKMSKVGLLSEDGSRFLLDYLENKIKPFQFNYFIKDALNKLTECFPVGRVVLDVGKCHLEDAVVQSVLLVWLFGNDLVVVSVDDLVDVQRCFVDDKRAPSVNFVQGRLSLSVLGQCSMIDSVVCFDDSVTECGFIGPEFGMRLLYKSLDSAATSFGFLDDIVSFARKQKSLYILSGDVGIN